MATFSSSALSAAITFTAQKKVLANLRANLVFADRGYAEQGTFQKGSDTLLFMNVADLSVATTPLTEGTAPTPQSLTLGTVTIDTDQYGATVDITDIAKVKSPFEVVEIAQERLSRQATETIDQIMRDVIAAGGTHKYHSTATAGTRADIDSSDLMTTSELRRLNTQMKKGKIKPFSDGFYRLWVHPNVAWNIKNDSTAPGGWLDINRYSRPEDIIQGEIGRAEGFRVMEVVNAPTYASTVTVYGSIAVGTTKGWGVGDLQTLQTYHVPLGGDHSDPIAQKELVGWKVDFGVAVLSNAYYYVYESFATAV